MAEMIEREAKLFEAGDYPDKGVEITEGDLDGMVAAFEEAPIRIEHSDTPFDGALGALKAIWRTGKELMGRVAFHPDAWALAERAGAKRLSLGIARDKSRITEVSLVNSPRIADAAVFCFDAGGTEDYIPRDVVIDRFAALMGGRDNANREEVNTHMAEEITPTPQPTVDFAAEKAKLEADLERERTERQALAERTKALEFRIKEQAVDSKIDSLKRDGKIVPATEPFARAILLASTSEVVKFGDKEGSIGDAFEAFIDAMPAIVKFGETGVRGSTPQTVEFSDAEIDMFLKMDPGKTREEAIEAMRKHAG